MDAIADLVAQLLFLGSMALLVWGAILAVGQLFSAYRERRMADRARDRGEDRRRTPRTAIASPRRGRFSRLVPPT